MDPYKLQRQNAALQRVLADLLATEVKDPRVGFVTVSGVKLSRDQTVAQVFVSALGGEEARRDSMAGLKKARGFLQGRLGDVLRLRATPDLRFVYDDSLDRGLGVDTILRDLSDRGDLEDEGARRLRMKLADLQPPAELMRALRAGGRIWLVPHWNPDPDAMGSCLALGEALAARGAEVVVFGYPDPPAGFAALPGFADVVPLERAAALLADAPPDRLVMLDCHRIDRAGEYADVLAGVPEAWTVDHHLVSGRRVPLDGWVEPAASATALLVMRIVEELAAADGDEAGTALSVDMATNIYAGLVTDTGGFRHPNTLPLTFEAAAALASRGVDVAGVTEAVLHRRTPAGMALLQRVLATLETHGEGRIALIRADRAMLAETGARLADTESFVGFATALEGVEFVAFLKELDDRTWRVSLRAPGGGDVQAVAARFGGGGHRAAAGCTLEGDLTAVSAALVPVLLDELAS